MSILKGSVKADSLALLADDYISPLLLNTLQREGIPAAVRGKRLKAELERFCPGLKVPDKAQALDIISKEDGRLLINSEGFLPCVIGTASAPARAERLRMLADKILFRELEREASPDYFFLEADSNIDAGRLKDLKAKLPSGKSYIIKPSSGSKGTGVRMLRIGGDLSQAGMDIGQTARLTAADSAPDALHGVGRLLIEEYIKGDEFACDAYIDSKGEPVVLGIYAHPLRDMEDFRDIVYYTGAGIMKKMLPRVSDFLRRLSDQTGVRSIPMHAEFRLQRNRLLPLEVNPLRFGSFSIPDLAFFAFRVNPYKNFFNQQKPNWDRILSQSGEELFFRVLARMPEGAGGKTPDHEEFADTFRDLVGYCKLDTSRYPAFAIAFGKTDDASEVRRYLNVDLKEFFK